MARPRVVVDAETDQAMHRLRTEGLSQDQIASRLGLSRYVVRTRLKESGPAPRLDPGQTRLLATVQPPAGRPRSPVYAGCGAPATPAGQRCRHR